MKWIILLLAMPVRAALVTTEFHDQGCVPKFFTHLPKDKRYYYGVGTGKLASDSRESAVQALALQAVGNSSASWAVAGFEQQDYAECDWVIYTLLRVSKSRVVENSRESPRDLENDLLQGELRAQEDRIVSRIQSTPTVQNINIITLPSRVQRQRYEEPVQKPRSRRVGPPSTYLRSLFGDDYFPDWCKSQGGVVQKDGSCLLTN